MILDAFGQISDQPRSAFVDLLRPGDLVVANDAATIPASLSGIHLPTRQPIEVRLAGRRSLGHDLREFSAIIFGAGDFRACLEDRPLPPPLALHDRLELGPLSATIVRLLDHPRLVLLSFDGSPDAIWAGLAHHGRPIQYEHVPTPLAIWDVWTAIAGPPVAFEAPSAGFVLSWQSLATLRARRVEFVTITHAAGLSSTGDPLLDLRLPFDEPYRISHAAADAIKQAKSHCGRIVAVGTTVVRALEHAARHGTIVAGEGLATQRIGAGTPLQVVDAILTGTHEPGTSHFELLRAFVDDNVLKRMTIELNVRRYRTHEFGDSAFIFQSFGRIPKEQRAWKPTVETTAPTSHRANVT